MPAWPADLPSDFLRRSYRETLEDVVIRTQVSTGPVKRRPRSTIASRIFNGAIIMTSAELLILRGFYVTTLGNGSLAFDFPDPLDSTIMLSIMFLSPYSFRNTSGNNYEVTLQLQTQP